MHTANALRLLLVSFCMLAACGSESSVDAGAGDRATPPPNQGTFWSTSVTQNGEPRPLVDGTRIQIDFDGDRISASAGCNSMGGTYSMTDSGVLEVSDMAMTEMGCDGARHAQDEFVSQFLTASPAINVGQETITLSNSTTIIELVDRKVADPDRPIIGTEWNVTGFFDLSVATSLNITDVAWLRFVDDSTAEGFDGCSEFTMDVEVSEGFTGGPIPDGADGELQFGSTLDEPPADCTDAPYAARVSASIRGQATYVIDGPNLTITAADGTGITFVATG